MIGRSIWPRRTMRGGKRFLVDCKAGRWWPCIILRVVAMGLVMCPWPSAAEESTTGVAPPPTITAPAEQGATGSIPAAKESLSISLDGLRTLLTSDERKELIGRLGALTAQGDIKGARDLLSGAISAGTLAIILFEQIEDPALHAWLQRMAVDIHQPDAPTTPQISMNSMAGFQEDKSAGIEEALQQERSRANTALEQLNAAQEQVTALKAIVAELRGETAREKDRASAALLELTATQRQVAALKGSAAEAAETKTMLEREREHSVSIAAELEALKQQFSNLTASTSKAPDIENAAAKEKQRADTALQQLNALQEQLSILEKSEAKAQENFRQEKERGAFMARQLETAIRQIDALTSEAENADEIKETLRQEKEKAAAALRELSAAKGQLTALNRAEFIPAALAFRAPLTLPEPSVNGPRSGAEQPLENSTGGREPQKVWRMPLPPRHGEPKEPASEFVRARPRDRKPSAQIGEPRVAKPLPGLHVPSAAPNRSVLAKVNRPHRLLVREIHGAPDVLDLPIVLRPDNRLWQFY